jgi:2-polyprenyl-3-methyl-5-hydroxy-6-metoxy-1,4-benzoquinol methylase
MANYRERLYKYYNSAFKRGTQTSAATWLKPRAPYINHIIQQHFPSNRATRIFDLGCGYGAFIHFAIQAGYQNIHGIDASPEQVLAAQALGIPNIEQGDLLEALRTQKDNLYDVVVAFDIIEHFHKDEMLDIVDEVLRILKTGGVFIIHTPNGESPFSSKIRFGDFTHEFIFTRTSINQLLLSSGFTKVACHEDTPIPHGLKSTVRAILWQFIRLGLAFYIAVETGQTEKKQIFSQNFLTVAYK